MVQRFLSILLFCVLLPATAWAQGLTVMFNPPAIRWTARPPMVVMAPGMWVVEDSPDEVFFYDGWYWTQTDDRWRVPARFYANAPGHYRHFRGDGGTAPRQIRREARPVRKGVAPARRQATPEKRHDKKDDRRGQKGGGKAGKPRGGHD
jgi:hypothetical protein